MASVESKPLTCDSFSSTLINGLEKLWKENQFCDITLKVEGREFHCHRNVLAANSEYFTSVFARDFKEKDKSLVVLPLEFEALSFQTLLEYFYSGNLVLTSENVEGVFKVADYIRLKTVVELSAKFLEETLEKSNCTRRFSMIDKLQFKSPCVESLYKTAGHMVVKEATKESVPIDFLELSHKLVSKILDLNNRPEDVESLFILTVRWVSHDEGNRQVYLNNLLQAIPVSGLSFDFFTTQMKTEELLRRNLEGLQWLLDCVVPQVTFPVCVHPDGSGSLFVANRGSYKNNCYQLQLSDSTKLVIGERPEMEHFCAISHKRRIYLMCGKKDQKTFMLEEGQREWVESNLNLYFDRCSPGAIVRDDDLFVVGGWCSVNDKVKSAAQFNFVTEETVSLPDMKERRDRPGIGLYGNSIYASCGGSKTIERFDTREGQWCEVGMSQLDIGECSSTTVGNFLYSCDISAGHMERFDFRSGRSEKVCSLSADGKACWITSLNEVLYASKGEGCILKYDKEGAGWLEICSDLDLVFPIIVPWM